MEFFSEKMEILKLINSNTKGVRINDIIDFFDYINKVRYEKEAIEELLSELIVENKIYNKKDLWFPK